MASITVGFLQPRPSPLIVSPTTFHQKQIPTTLFSKSLLHSSNTIFSSSISPLFSDRWRPSSANAEAFEPESEPDSEPDSESTQIVEPDQIQEPNSEPAQLAEESSEVPKKGVEIFAVVMVGSRQYIVIPGRSIYTQRLKGANVNDKIILNKVLLVSTKSEAYIGKPVVSNAAVHAIVEEQGLNKKVVVFKYKKKKNYRRNIGHRQPNTRIRITGITGYEDFPASTLAAAA
ncbi:large ribosomal subunit protein bL21c [Magnolia sinica]|uniref:large ribosomal subunit protein bL21c n=1 Tax=Magnolia sinica TaxID=86752 RepID=UPI00265B3550|nr:large ribosomal subunit protein bL21c [Magnolia sinica]